MSLFLFFPISNDDEERSVGTITEQLEGILAKMDGVGQVELYIHYEEASTQDGLFSTYFQTSESQSPITGILIVAEGANTEGVKQALITTVSKVLQVSPHRIAIVQMNNKEALY